MQSWKLQQPESLVHPQRQSKFLISLPQSQLKDMQPKPQLQLLYSKLPTNLFVLVLKDPTKEKWGTSGGIAAADTPEPKRTRSVSSRQAAPTATPPTSPLQKKKKTLSAASSQESLKDRLRSASKKH